MVELLIVTGIIALLIAILLPVLSAAQEHARRVKCLSNSRQLTAAWLMYAYDHQGHFCSSETQLFSRPIWGDYYIAGFSQGMPAGFWSWIAWSDNKTHDIPHGMLWPYLKDLGVYSCPGNPVLPNTSYAVNARLAGRVGDPFPWFTLSQIRHPSAVFVFIEAMSHTDDGDRDFDADEMGVGRAPINGGFVTEFYPSQFSQTPGQFHGLGRTNGCTVTFADGHSVFWQYTDWARLPPKGVSSAARLAQGEQDLLQLQAWTGGPIPPGVTP